VIESQEANRRAQDPTPPGNSLNDLVPSESRRQEMIQIQKKKGHFCSRSEAHPTGQAVAFEPVTTVLLFIAISWIGGLMWNSSRQIRSHVYGLVQRRIRSLGLRSATSAYRFSSLWTNELIKAGAC